MVFRVGLVAFLTLTVYVCIEGRNFPRQRVKIHTKTPDFLLKGSHDNRSAFKKVTSRNNVTKWTQTVDGIPVYGSVLTTHEDRQGNIKSVQGTASKAAGRVNTRPKISAEEAVILVRVYWNHMLDEEEAIVTVDDAKLQVLETGDRFDKLVYKVGYFINWRTGERSDYEGVIPAYITGLVDARAGEVVRSWNGLQSIYYRVTPAVTVVAVAGNEIKGEKYVDIDIEYVAGDTCKHKDSRRRVEVINLSNKRSPDGDTTSEFSCSQAADIDQEVLMATGAYNPRNDAFYHAAQFVDMWQKLIGDAQRPYRDATSYLTFYAHYGYEYGNAFFNGDGFYLGDGGSSVYPLTSLDIICHEIGHAITSWHGGNMEYHSQSGGINEAYSDILAETCDIYYNQKTDYLIGEEVAKDLTPPYIRNMCNPVEGGSLDHISQYESRGVWDLPGVHHSSGIYNKAWCTLIHKTGWNFIKAFEVFTDANLMYWNPISTMHCGACGVETAAEDRGYTKSAVTAAFSVVGVSCGKC